MAIFPVTTATKISLASGGLVYLEFTTHGDPGSTFRRGSVATPLASQNDAVSRMLAFIPALKQWGESYAATRLFHGKPSGHANVIAIEGGHPFRPSKLPSFCRVYFEVGMMAGDNPEPIVAGARQLATEYGRAQNIELDVEVVKIAHGAEISADAPLVTALSDAHEAIWGQRPELTWDGWCTDSAVLMRAGIPALSYGASGRRRSGQPGYPREGEQVNVGDLTRTAEVFTRLACDLGMRDRDAVAQGQARAAPQGG
jgi:acetylornithine deacetylase/succinyl-diaminopimelate desuccinylase-like protein